jgi:hypothetical protein
MVNLHRRLQALEKRLVSEPIRLQMPDGRVVTLPCDCAGDLLLQACRGARTPEIELLAQSISSTEPGGGHLVDLARALVNTPTEEIG